MVDAVVATYTSCAHMTSHLYLQSERMMHTRTPGQGASRTRRLLGLLTLTVAALVASLAVPSTAAQARVIGADDRTYIGDTTTFPARTVVRITYGGAFYPDGQSWCSGFLISPNRVATAGHCLQMNGRSAPVSAIGVTVGLDNYEQPYGSACSARGWWVHPNWTRYENFNYDYGVIKLNCSYSSSNVASMWATTSNTNTLVGNNTSGFGYPFDKGGRTMWRGRGEITSAPNALLLRYNHDMEQGDSGGPIYTYNLWEPCGKRFCVIAINSHEHNASPYYNAGVRITPTVRDNLLSQ